MELKLASCAGVKSVLVNCLCKFSFRAFKTKASFNCVSCVIVVFNETILRALAYLRLGNSNISLIIFLILLNEIKFIISIGILIRSLRILKLLSSFENSMPFLLNNCPVGSNVLHILLVTSKKSLL